MSVADSREETVRTRRSTDNRQREDLCAVLQQGHGVDAADSTVCGDPQRRMLRFFVVGPDGNCGHQYDRADRQRLQTLISRMFSQPRPEVAPSRLGIAANPKSRQPFAPGRLRLARAASAEAPVRRAPHATATTCQISFIANLSCTTYWVPPPRVICPILPRAAGDRD